MHDFRKILYATQEPDQESAALRQALSLARNNRGTLHVMVVTPEVPDSLGKYRETYTNAPVEAARSRVNAAREALKLAADEAPAEYSIDSGGAPGIRIVRQALRGGFDLVVKDAEHGDGGRGFRSVDMELLRKCPCAVWLARPIGHSRGDIRVAVAVDPEDADAEGRDLSLRLLTLARALADTASGSLDVLSCWYYEFEKRPASNSWIPVPRDELTRIVDEFRLYHRDALDKLVADAGIGGALNVAHLHGKAEDEIPAFIDDNVVDILVMGTVARTGIPGFIIGNTAENLLRRIGCSLLALKPNGFVSPVKAY
ncbi:MAG: universal stress protein [Gammaproteobacteria bacterium]|nr:universal stress protein [Gammaproteobacteria bacterium]